MQILHYTYVIFDQYFLIFTFKFSTTIESINNNNNNKAGSWGYSSINIEIFYLDIATFKEPAQAINNNICKTFFQIVNMKSFLASGSMFFSSIYKNL